MIPGFIKPQKQIIASCVGFTGVAFWPTPFGDEDQSWQGGDSPRYNQWEVTLNISTPQSHGYPYSAVPYQYNGLDVNMGGFISRSTQGMIYRVKEVISKTPTTVKLIVEDVYRVMDFITPKSTPINPALEQYVYFEVNGDFKAEINGGTISGLIPAAILHYIDTYLDKIAFTRYPILCCDETMDIGDVVAISDGKFVRATHPTFTKVVGKVELSTGVEHEYVVNPVHEYRSIPSNQGVVGDILYLSDDGQSLTTAPTMKPMYLKVMDGTPNVSTSRLMDNPVIPVNSSIEINGHAFSFAEETSLVDFVEIFNTRNIPDMSASTASSPFTISNTSNYEFGIMGIMDLPAVFTINGHEVTITTTVEGQKQYGMEVAIGLDMAKDINDANVPGITAEYSTSTSRLNITNISGGDIIFANVSGGTFASDTGSSGSGFLLSYVAPTDNVIVKLTHSLGKEIIIRDVGLGTFSERSGIASSDNGKLPRGIYYGSTLRYGSNYVIDHIDDISTVNAFVGDGLHVRDSGNGEWVEMKYTATGWVTIATQDSARTDADTLSVVLDHTYQGEIYLGTVSQNSRITSISVVVDEAFDDPMVTLDVGDVDNNSRLMSDDHIDLLNASTYSSSSSHVYDVETDLSVWIGSHSSTKGSVKIVVSYQ